MCYAYRDRDVEELLVEHMVETGRCCLSRWEVKAISDKISRTINVDVDSAKSAIVLSALLHDIGKSASVYQVKCFENLCNEFPGHYMLSTFIIHLVYSISGIDIRINDVKSFLSDNFNNLSEDKIIAMLVLLPTAFHHYHQVKGFKSYRSTGSEVVEGFLDKPSIHRKCLEDIKDILSFSGVGAEGLVFINRLYKVLWGIEEYVNLDPYRISKMFISNFYKEVVLGQNIEIQGITLGKMIIEAVSGLINLCDGYVASRARRR